MESEEYKKAYERYFEVKNRLDKAPLRSFIFGLYSKLERYYNSELDILSHKNI